MLAGGHDSEFGGWLRRSCLDSPETGKFAIFDIRLGSRGDSYYEYLLKQWIQTVCSRLRTQGEENLGLINDEFGRIGQSLSIAR